MLERKVCTYEFLITHVSPVISDLFIIVAFCTRVALKEHRELNNYNVFFIITLTYPAY